MKCEDFGMHMARLRSCYSNAVQDPEMWALSVATYYEHTRRFPDEAIRGAFAIAWHRHREWMPSLGQFVELISELLVGAHPTADEAWSEVRLVASGSRQAHSDPLAREAMRQIGGRDRLRMLDDADMAWARKDFVRIYRELAERELEAGAISALPAPGRLARIK